MGSRGESKEGVLGQELISEEKCRWDNDPCKDCWAVLRKRKWGYYRAALAVLWMCVVVLICDAWRMIFEDTGMISFE
jgi:hypothetical protein